MAKLLIIEASPRKTRSASIQVADAFAAAYADANPDDTVEKLDLWALDLPAFDGDTINAKYRVLHGQKHTAEEAAAWKAVADMANRFASADKFLFSVPMWNFGIPYQLKHFIDIITQPGLTFSYTPEEGYKGLVTGKPAAVVYARGGAYSDDSMKAMDFQKPYVELLLGFIGFTDIREIVVEPTLMADDPEAVKTNAARQAAELARSF
jgi:FMN-dependent NADH-azoreductase